MHICIMYIEWMEWVVCFQYLQLRIVGSITEIMYYMGWVQRVVYFSLPRLLPDWTVFIWVTRWVSYKKQELLTVREHVITLRFYGGFRIAYLFSLCLVLLCVFTLSSVWWCPLWFPHKNNVRFVFTSDCLWEGSCLIYVICVCLRIVVSNRHCIVFLLCFSSSCVPYIANFSGSPFLIAPSVYSLTFKNF
jgi:hypothetical protein